MNQKIIDFALEAGVLEPVEGVVEDDNVETFARYIIEECIDVIRYMENPDAPRDDVYLDLEWERGQVDACHAIKAHFGLTDNWFYRGKENKNE